MSSFFRLLSLFWVYYIIIQLSLGKPLGNTKKCIENALITSNNDCYYPEITASQAIRSLRDKWIVFMGESTLRQLFLQFLGIIKSERFDRIPDQKNSIKMEERLAGSRYTFYYLEYYNNISDKLMDSPPTLYDGRKPDLIILNDGLHDILYDFSNSEGSFNKLSDLLINKYKNELIMWIPSPQIHDNYLTKHRKDSEIFTNKSVSEIVLKQKELISRLNNAHFYNIFRNISYNKWNFDGIHNMERARIEAEGLIRTFYYLEKDPDAWQTDKLTCGQIMVFLCYSIITAIVLIGELSKKLFYLKKINVKSSSFTLSMERESLLSSDDTHNDGTGSSSTSTQLSHRRDGHGGTVTVPIDKNDSKKTDNIDDEYEIILPPIFEFNFVIFFLSSYIKNCKYFQSAFQFGVCLILLYLFDGPQHIFVSPSLKHYNRDFFIFLHLIFLLISYLTFTQNPKRDSDKILSRLQTEEWKGIMQIIFVMYHYFDASEIYNMIRVFIGAYVWMTGFGNTVFFLNKKIFNTTRLFGMLFRLNWLVFWVCLLLNQPLMLYYICPLHTFFFLLTYLLWGCAHQLNDLPYVITIKLILCGIFLVVLFETPQYIFNGFWYPSKFILDLHGTLYEWHFRTTLDHYATYLGMIFAVYYDNIYKILTVNLKNKISVKIFISVICFLLIIIWYKFVYIHDKYTYNAMHPYTESIPIFTYIILRNLYSPLRSYYSSFLAWMGQITLETYIFQYHLYMINDAKSILTILPNYPLCNFILVSIFYLWISRIAFNSTNTLRNFFYPVKKGVKNIDVIKQTLIYCAILFLFYICAYLIEMAINNN